MAAEHSTPLSRRAILSRAVAAAPAVALTSLPAIASTAVPPDAELIALGREIEAALRRNIIVTLESTVLGFKVHELANERSGLSDEKYDDPQTPTELEEYRVVVARFMEELKAANVELGCDYWDEKYAAASKEECRLIDAVSTLQATTPEGVRVKMLAVVAAEYIMIAHKPESRDYSERVTRDLCLAVLADLGIEIPERLIAVV